MLKLTRDSSQNILLSADIISTQLLLVGL